MKNLLLVLACATIAFVSLSFCNAHKSSTNAAHTGIKWMTWEQVAEAQKTKPKKIFVDVYTGWCGWCKKMDATTFENPVIIEQLNKDFYAIKFDAESKASINFNGKTYENKGRYHDIATEYMGNQLGFPTSLYLDEKNQLLTPPIASYLEAKQLEEILAYFSGNFHQKLPYDEFLKTFKGKAK